MGPLQYRNFGDHETLVFSHAVNVDGAGLVGLRWYELRRTPPGTGNWVIQQQGTFAPADSTTTTTTSIDRWTSSIAMDQAGNLAMGTTCRTTALRLIRRCFRESMWLDGWLQTRPGR